MHKYLRAIGFSQYTKKREEEQLMARLEESSSECKSCSDFEGENRVEMKVEVAPGLGVTICGRENEEGEFVREYYFPYVSGTEVSTTAPCQIQKHADKDSFSGLSEEYRLGISLIYYLQNGLEYESRCLDIFRPSAISGIRLGALSVSGKILIPLKKTKEQIEMAKVSTENRSALLEAARLGDETAMETLTLEDMNTYTSISQRVNKEDVYSILDSCFMPYGVECDQYSILGTILDSQELENTMSGDHIHILKVECNDLIFEVAINAKDLMGQPAVGRRFKGDIWLQGMAEFKEF